MTISTPWRYPGSKRKLAPRLRELIPANITAYCEPFVGGGASALPVLEHSTQRNLLDSEPRDRLKVLLNDGDSRVAIWWSVMAGKKENTFQGLISMIEDQEVITPELFYEMQDMGTNPANVRLIRAYAAIFINRTAFSGILSGGPIGGQKQDSPYKIDCRWNTARLVKQHNRVRELLTPHDVTVRDDDFREVMKDLPDEYWVYADPPYRRQGMQLYPQEFDDQAHEDLALLLHGRDHWLLSYDDHPWVRERYADCRITEETAGYSISGLKRKSHVKRQELLIMPR